MPVSHFPTRKKADRLVVRRALAGKKAILASCGKLLVSAGLIARSDSPQGHRAAVRYAVAARQGGASERRRLRRDGLKKPLYDNRGSGQQALSALAVEIAAQQRAAFPPLSADAGLEILDIA